MQRFPTQLESALWSEHDATPPLNVPGNLGITIASAQTTNQIFGETAGSYLPFIDSISTARDMLEIVKAHGRDKISYYGVSSVPCVFLSRS